MRVKVYDAGTINPKQLEFNKIKSNFTRILEVYDEVNKTIIVSEYSNDGSMQTYISRLKTANVKLTEEHIEFLLFSLF